MFIVELLTTTGKVCERYATYDEARRRVDQFPVESLVGIAFIFEELADGSQRLVREDGKPLQWHRLAMDGASGPDEAIPLADESSGLLGAEKWVVSLQHCRIIVSGCDRTGYCIGAETSALHRSQKNRGFWRMATVQGHHREMRPAPLPMRLALPACAKRLPASMVSRSSATFT